MPIDTALEQPETHTDINHPLPPGTRLGYDEDSRGAIPQNAGSEIRIDEFDTTPDGETTYTVTYLSPTASGDDVTKTLEAHWINSYLLEDKYPWFLKHQPDA